MYWSSLLSDFNVQFELFFTTVENTNASGDEENNVEPDSPSSPKHAKCNLLFSEQKCYR